MNSDRIEVQETLPIYYHFCITGKLDYIIKSLEECKAMGWEGIDYKYADGDRELVLYRTRLENDQEYKTRIKLEAKKKELRRKQYETLSKEFGQAT